MRSGIEGESENAVVGGAGVGRGRQKESTKII